MQVIHIKSFKTDECHISYFLPNDKSIACEIDRRSIPLFYLCYFVKRASITCEFDQVNENKSFLVKILKMIIKDDSYF